MRRKNREIRSQLSEKQKRIIRAVGIIVALIFFTVAGWFIGKPMIRFVSEPEQFRAWVEEKGILSDLIFVGMVIFQVIIAVIPGEPLEIGAGYAFGALWGTVLCLVGTTVGGILVFLAVRKWGVRLAEMFFDVDKLRQLKFLREKKKRDILTFFLFFLPGTPKDLLCYFVGLTDMELKTWIIITSVARIPSVVTSTVGGHALGEQNYWFAVAVFAVTLILSGLGLLAYRKLLARRENADPSLPRKKRPKWHRRKSEQKRERRRAKLRNLRAKLRKKK